MHHVPGWYWQYNQSDVEVQGGPCKDIKETGDAAMGWADYTLQHGDVDLGIDPRDVKLVVSLEQMAKELRKMNSHFHTQPNILMRNTNQNIVPIQGNPFNKSDSFNGF